MSAAVTPLEVSNLPEIVRWVDLAGVFANALIGGAMARTKNLDPVGFVAIALLSALGGGVLRDTLLQSGRPVALTDTWYLAVALIGAAIAYAVAVTSRVWHRTWIVVDALALGCWAGVGTLKSLGLDAPFLPAVLLGVVTAVGGGAIRDIALNEVPGVFGRSPLYATCALLSAALTAVGWVAGHPVAGLALGAAAGTVLALVARQRGWYLPLEVRWRAVSLARAKGLARAAGRDKGTRARRDVGGD